VEVDQAAARGTISRLKEIEAQGRDGAWQALSWLVERRHPAEFAEPEVALNIGIQNKVNGGSSNDSNFEALVVSDLEFLGLRQREGYEHRPGQRPAREVEASVHRIPDDVAGTLVRADYPGSAIISQSQEAENRRRLQEVDTKIAKLLAAKRNGGPAMPDFPEATRNAIVHSAIVMPAGEPSESWWGQLSQGDNSRTIAKEAAVYACRTLVREVLGALVAQATIVDFQTDPVVLRDLHNAIQDLVGPRGWSALLKKGGRGE
jgi:hypothetical protein